MPTYDYECRACKARVEYFQPMSEAPKKKCPECGARKLERKIGIGAAVLFKGSGFYQTDYRSDAYRKSAEADKAQPAPCAGDPKSCAAGGGPCAGGSADGSSTPAPPYKGDSKSKPGAGESKGARRKRP